MPHWVAESVIAFCFVVSLFGVAMAAHRWVEVPGRRVVRRLGDRLLRPRGDTRLSRG
jgi:hypothetical protein